ncbi:MAG: glycoside hydrolase family 1 protein [Acidobacteria bacterium]|nr:glycoside hydrolase family 1 protein [Acidobacteriota bacterium]MBV9482202.1 glycoside hydrolase family 1 protein [Acidobacteriota bacterium]
MSTAAHQVEGGNEKNQWADWEAAGKTKSREVSGRACDWWNNAECDFDLARDLGLNALRLSLEWSRIEPAPGQWNREALGRYRQMLEALNRRRLQPIVSLHHFTHPRWFEEEGGFLSNRAAQRFERFAYRVVDEFGDLCRFWVTFNEPNVFAALGYVLGEFPPGRLGDVSTALRVVDAMAASHACAYRAIHRVQPQAQVGWAHHYVVFKPRRRSFLLDRWSAALLNRLFNESFLIAVERGQSANPINLDGKFLRPVQGTCDFVGVNIYSRFHVAFSLGHASELFTKVYVPGHVPQGDAGVERPYGEAYPGAVAAAVERCARLGKPLYILENGVPDAQDRIRPWLIRNVIRELERLIREGKDIRGYFHWTLTDNFEWSEGWGLRFGLFELDQTTQQRRMRPSARLYGAIAQANGITSEVNRLFPEIL